MRRSPQPAFAQVRSYIEEGVERDRQELEQYIKRL